MKAVSLEDFKAALEKGLTSKEKIFDVRRPDEFQKQHIEGAENLSYDSVSSNLNVFEGLDKAYFYCTAGVRSKAACESLEKAGIDSDKLITVEGMSKDWEKIGLPTVKRAGVKFSIQRQIYLLASSIILIGLILSLSSSMWFIILPFLVGGGMLFSAIKGVCYSELMLAKMPWNR